jgi:hypothetical protein
VTELEELPNEMRAGSRAKMIGGDVAREATSEAPSSPSRCDHDHEMLLNDTSDDELEYSRTQEVKANVTS